MRRAVAPRLSRRLTLEAIETLPDGGGGTVAAWVPLGTLWAELRPRSAREVRSAEVTASRVTHRVTVRSAPEGSPRRPKAEQRFRAGGRVFDILGVAEADDAGAFLVCWVEEGPYT